MRNFNENMNSYMFNKIRMMAVACGIAIVSGNICGYGGTTQTPIENTSGTGGAVQEIKYDSSNTGFVNAVKGKHFDDNGNSVNTCILKSSLKDTYKIDSREIFDKDGNLLNNLHLGGEGVDYTNHVQKNIVNGWKILGQSICNNGNLKDDLDNVFMLKSDVDNNYKKKEDLSGIVVNGVKLLNNNFNNIDNLAKQAIINNATAKELGNNAAYKTATSKSVVDPSTYVLKGDLGKIKNANNKTLFANNDYTKVNGNYINGLSAKELGNNAAYKNAVKNATDGELKGNAVYNALVKKVASLWTKEKLKNKHFDKDGNEDENNTYIKADDKTAIESTATYKTLKATYEKVLSEKPKNDKPKNEEVKVGDRVVVEYNYGNQSRECYLVVTGGKSSEDSIALNTIKKTVITFGVRKKGATFKVTPGSVSFKAEKEESCTVNVKVKYVLERDKE